MNWHGEKRSNETHESKTDPEARLARKGDQQAAKLCYAGHVLMENRNGLVVDIELTEANGRAEREAGLKMLKRRGRGRSTVGADKGYDTKDFVKGCRDLKVTPHVAQTSTATGAAPSMAGPPGSSATRSASAFGSGSRRSSGGGKRWLEGANCATSDNAETTIGRRWTSAAFNLVRLANLTAQAA